MDKLGFYWFLLKSAGKQLGIISTGALPCLTK